MKKYVIRSTVLLLLFMSLASAETTAFGNTARYSVFDRAADTSFARTELYFGRNKPDGSTVSEEDWRKFVDEIITPRFPDGFTVLNGDGQFRGKDGAIVREESKVLILFYERKDRKPVGSRIEEIRGEYKKRFNQESVLRLDLTKSVRVSF
jgi:hypothetical protein